MTTKHTPTPWYIAKQYRIKIFPDKTTIISKSGGGVQYVAWCEQDGGCGGHYKEEAIANAEFIVKACNSHDDLLETCKLVRNFLKLLRKKHSYSDKQDIVTIVALLEEAIAKASK